jgi:hypothetical protein
MIKNYIKETLELNKVDLSSNKGYKLYYSKSKNIFNATFFGFAVILNVWLLTESISDKGNLPWSIVGILLFSYELHKSISKIICKNPILVLSEGKIYYLKTQAWYNLDDYIFEDKFYITTLSWPNPSRTFYMEDKTQQVIFAINNWYLSDSDDFKKKLTFQRAMILKAKHKII